MAVGGSHGVRSSAEREPLGFGLWLGSDAAVLGAQRGAGRAGFSGSIGGHALLSALVGAPGIVGPPLPHLPALFILTEGRPWPVLPGVSWVGRVTAGEAGAKLRRLSQAGFRQGQAAEDVCL